MRPDGRIEHVLTDTDTMYPYFSINRAGQLALTDSLPLGVTDRIYVIDTDGTEIPIVSRGDAIEIAPGDVRMIQSLSRPLLNNRGQSLFTASFDNEHWAMFISNNALLPDHACDFDLDARCDIVDIDMLVRKVSRGGEDLLFDLNGDEMINRDDIAEWLAAAGSLNIAPDVAYLVGDIDLNGIVDALDLNALALAWQQNIPAWSAGDLTADGVVESSDLNLLAHNWQQRASVPMLVPEPHGFCVSLVSLTITILMFQDAGPNRGRIAERNGLFNPKHKGLAGRHDLASASALRGTQRLR